MKIVGRHSVQGAITYRPECIQKLWVEDKSTLPKRLRKEGLCQPITQSSRKARHQGYVAEVSIEDWILNTKCFFSQTPDGFWLVMDHLEDPQNMGAVCRSAALLGVTGIVYAKARQAQISEVVVKASSGLIFALELVQVPNIGQFLDRFRKEWAGRIYGLDMAGDQSISEFKVQKPGALVLGAEGAGVSEGLKKRIDEMFQISMTLKGHSLNVAQSTAIALYQASL